MKDLVKFSKQITHSDNAIIRQVQKIIIFEENAGQRIDNFLLRIYKNVPKDHIYRILRSGEVRVNKCRIKQIYRLSIGDVIRVPPISFPKKIDFNTISHSKFQILFEDNYLLIIDKPAGIAVHAGSGISYGVIEQLRATQKKIKFLELVHRIDRETSGILLLAKKRSALINLHAQMRHGYIDKHYLTLVHGNWKNIQQHVKLPLHKYYTFNGECRTRIQKNGQESYTIFSLVRHYKMFTLLNAELKTGRTHQIRAHLFASGFSIVGDKKYGNFTLNRMLQKTDCIFSNFRRMFLHAYKITFIHPENGKIITIKARLPAECKLFLQKIETLINVENNSI